MNPSPVHCNPGKPKYPCESNHSLSLLRKKILDPHMKTFSLCYVFSGVRFRQVPLCAHLAFTQCMTVGFTSVVVWFALVSVDFAIEAVGFVLSSFVYFSMFLKNSLFVLHKRLFTLFATHRRPTFKIYLNMKLVRFSEKHLFGPIKEHIDKQCRWHGSMLWFGVLPIFFAQNESNAVIYAVLIVHHLSSRLNYKK